MVGLLVVGYVHLRPVRVCRRVGGTKSWDVMPRDHRLKLDRRRMIEGSLALVGLGLLSGCEPPGFPWQAAKVPGSASSGSARARGGRG